jgi:flagellar biogenesis protein FliO
MAQALRIGLARLSAFPWPRLWKPPSRRLRVCETLSLGNRGFLAVIECEHEQLLIGGTANSLALLTRLPSPADGSLRTRFHEDKET